MVEMINGRKWNEENGQIRDRIEKIIIDFEEKFAFIG